MKKKEKCCIAIIIINHNSNTMHKFIYSQIQMHNTGENKYTGDSVVQVRTVYKLLTSVLRHVERERILTMLTILSDSTNAWRILRCLRSLSVEICKTPTTCFNGRELNSLCPNRRELNCLPTWSIVNRKLSLFKNPQILSPSFLGTTSSTLQLHFLSEGSI